MQSFCNKIYNNAHNIIGWYLKKENMNVDRVTETATDAGGIGTGGGRTLEG